MIFLTKFNLEKLVYALRTHAKIDELEIDNSNLQRLGIDPKYFTQHQQERIKICTMLFDIDKIKHTEFIAKTISFTQSTSHWIFPPQQPAYHKYSTCINISSNFTNIAIPEQLPSNVIEDYRQFFLDNYKNYAYRDGKKDPNIFGRMILEKYGKENLFDPAIIQKHNDNELISLWVSKHFSQTEYENSGLSELVNIGFSVDDNEVSSLLQDIKNYGFDFKKLIENEKAEDIQKAYIFLQPEETWNKPALEYDRFKTITFSKPLTDNDREKYKKIAQLQKVLSNKVVLSYVLELTKRGIPISDQILEQAGFRLCSNCRQIEIAERLEQLRGY